MDWVVCSVMTEHWLKDDAFILEQMLSRDQQGQVIFICTANYELTWNKSH
jgi:hypothetical protein